MPAPVWIAVGGAVEGGAIIIRNIPAGLGRRGRQLCVKHGIVHGRLPASMSRAIGCHAAAPRRGQRRVACTRMRSSALGSTTCTCTAAHTALKHNQVVS